MEDTHWDAWTIIFLNLGFVLILVLMEDTHWVVNYYVNRVAHGLNPCFNGRYSLRRRELIFAPSTSLNLVLMEDTHWGVLYRPKWRVCCRLNPCFNGRYSLRGVLVLWFSCFCFVLILVLMEDTHWGRVAREIITGERVLILVLMEDTHWGQLRGFC